MRLQKYRRVNSIHWQWHVCRRPPTPPLVRWAGPGRGRCAEGVCCVFVVWAARAHGAAANLRVGAGLGTTGPEGVLEMTNTDRRITARTAVPSFHRLGSCYLLRKLGNDDTRTTARFRARQRRVRLSRRSRFLKLLIEQARRCWAMRREDHAGTLSALRASGHSIVAGCRVPPPRNFRSATSRLPMRVFGRWHPHSSRWNLSRRMNSTVIACGWKPIRPPYETLHHCPRNKQQCERSGGSFGSRPPRANSVPENVGADF